MTTPLELPAARLAQRREHLMTKIRTTPQARGARSSKIRRHWTWRTAVAVAALAIFGGGTIATAGPHAVVRQANGAVAIDTSQLQLVHDGHAVAGEQAKTFHIFANNEELACQGITLAFDTDAAANKYLAEYKTRLERRRARAGAAATSQAPCAAVADAPRFLESTAK